MQMYYQNEFILSLVLLADGVGYRFEVDPDHSWYYKLRIDGISDDKRVLIQKLLDGAVNAPFKIFVL